LELGQLHLTTEVAVLCKELF